MRLSSGSSILLFLSSLLLSYDNNSKLFALGQTFSNVDYTYVKDDFEDQHVLKIGSSGYTDLIFMPDDKGLLISEKDGAIRYYDDFQYSENNAVILDITEKVCTNNERGLQSIALHPNFGDESGQYNYLYMFYTYSKNGNCDEDGTNGPVNIVSRFVFNPSKNKIDASTEFILIEGGSLPKNYHNGGGMEFGIDGKLFVTMGDGGHKDDDITQNPSNIFGSILRLNDDGTVPEDNPFASTGVSCAMGGGDLSARYASGDPPCSETYSYAFRNPFSLTMNPHNTTHVHFYVNDVGGTEFEEINEGGYAFQKFDYGWPTREGPCNHRVITNCDAPDPFLYPLNKEPLHWYTHCRELGEMCSRAIIGSTFVPKEAGWPEEYTTDPYIYIEYRLGIFHMKHTGKEDRTVWPPVSNYESIPLRFFERPVRMKFGPYEQGSNGKVALYYTTRDFAGELRRLTYIGEGGNRAPSASLDVLLEDGGAGLSIMLDGSESYDPDHKTETDPGTSLLTYVFDFGDGSEPVDNGNVATIDYEYKEAGTYITSIKVFDDQGSFSTKSLEVSVGVEPRQLVDFIWYEEGANDDCPTDGDHDYCGIMEFCFEENDGMEVYGYRNPCADDVEVCECNPGPGPVIRMKPGNKYRFILRNKALLGTAPTNIHTHGLHIVGSGDSDNVIRRVKGGNCLDYTWDIAADHPDGTSWYHPHFHGHSEAQVEGGAFGMLVIETSEEFYSTSPPPAWVYNELLLQISRVDNVVRGNGNFQEPLYIKGQQWYHLRVSYVDPFGKGEDFLFDDIDGICEHYKVAADGVWYSTVPFVSSDTNAYELTGASRGDFAIRCSGPVGSKVNIKLAGKVAAVLNIDSIEDAANQYELGVWNPPRPYSLDGTDILGATVVDDNKFEIETAQDTINGVEWDPNVPLATIAYDEVHEWTLSDTRDHPFHTHLYHMMVVTPGGCGAHYEGEFYDTIAGPPCTVRFKTADFGERFVFHCHVLQHQESGSMAWIDVQGPNMPVNDVDSPEYTCECQPFPLLPVGEVFRTGQTASFPEVNLYIRQNFNGNLVVREGQPGDTVRGDVIWESGYVTDVSGNHFTTLEANGEFATYPGTPEDRGDKVWSTEDTFEDGDYLFAFTCDGTVGIFRGTHNNIGEAVWRAEPSKAPTRSPTKLPTEAPTSKEPTSPTVSPTPLPTNSPTVFVPTKSPQPTKCQPTVLLTTSEGGPSIIQSGAKNVIILEDMYMKQNFDGMLVIRSGHPDDDTPGPIIWKNSHVSDADGDHYTVINNNGQLLTFQGTPDNTQGESVWDFGYIGDAVGDYYFAMKCDGSVAIFEGLPPDAPTPIPTTPPTVSTTTAPTSSPIEVTVPPTSSPIESTIPPTAGTALPTIKPTAVEATPMPSTNNNDVVPEPTSAPFSFGECQGDCTDDSDCVDDLICFKLQDGSTVVDIPGCESATSTFRAAVAICVDPSFNDDEPTPAPSVTIADTTATPTTSSPTTTKSGASSNLPSVCYSVLFLLSIWLVGM